MPGNARFPALWLRAISDALFRPLALATTLMRGFSFCLLRKLLDSLAGLRECPCTFPLSSPMAPGFWAKTNLRDPAAPGACCGRLGRSRHSKISIMRCGTTTQIHRFLYEASVFTHNDALDIHAFAFNHGDQFSAGIPMNLTYPAAWLTLHFLYYISIRVSKKEKKKNINKQSFEFELQRECCLLKAPRR